MATLARQFSCFFLIILSTCHQTQARESRFFSKYLHFSTNNYVNVPSSTNLKLDVPSSPTPSSAPTTSQISGVPASAPMWAGSGPSPAPTPTTLQVGDIPAPAPIALGADYTPAPAPASTTLGADYTPVPAPSVDEVSYYGLYGKNNNEEEEEEFSTVDPEEQNSNKETYTYSNDELSNDNSFWTSNHKGYYNTNSGYGSNGGYKSEPQGMSDTRIAENSKYHYNTELENYSPSGYTNEPQGTRFYDTNRENYSPNELKSEPQGMSDTRLVNNGKYYYGVEQENYSPVEGENNNEEGYYFGGSYKKSKYEFDSMEEYEKQQGYADVQQEEYINP